MRVRSDRLLFYALLPFGGIVVALFALLINVLVDNSIPILEREGLNFFTSPQWRPSETPGEEFYGILAPLYGTIYTSIIAVAIALPTSVSLAVFVTDLAPPRLRELFIGLVDVMAGLPTILYGIWGALVLAPFLKDRLMDPLHTYLGFVPLFSCQPVTGYTVFTAGLILALMVVPFMTAVIREAYSRIPDTYREAVYSLGATDYEAARTLVSMIRPAILAALLLGFGRAAGETIAVSLTVGNSASISACAFTPGYTIASLIANQFANAGLYRHMTSALYAAGLILLVIGLALNTAGLYMLARWRKTRVGR